MKMLALAGRNAKEILRDPINLVFGLGFPVVLLLLMTLIQQNAPVDIFEISHLTPGIAVFGLAFMTLFSATMLAKDRASAFLLRLYTTPLKASDFIIGYTLPILPMAVAQSVICYALAVALGLPPSVNILFAVLLSVPAAVFFTALGLLCGSVFTDKQVGGICGALLTNLTAFTSGAWFDVSLIGGAFARLVELLPFYHAVELGRAALAGNFAGILLHLWWVLGYAVLTSLLAILLFVKQRKRL